MASINAHESQGFSHEFVTWLIIFPSVLNPILDNSDYFSVDCSWGFIPPMIYLSEVD